MSANKHTDKLPPDVPRADEPTDRVLSLALRSQRKGRQNGQVPLPVETSRCPACGCKDLLREEGHLVCRGCNLVIQIPENDAKKVEPVGQQIFNAKSDFDSQLKDSIAKMASLRKLDPDIENYAYELHCKLKGLKPPYHKAADDETYVAGLILAACRIKSIAVTPSELGKVNGSYSTNNRSNIIKTSEHIEKRFEMGTKKPFLPVDFIARYTGLLLEDENEDEKTKVTPEEKNVIADKAAKLAERFEFKDRDTMPQVIAAISIELACESEGRRYSLSEISLKLCVSESSLRKAMNLAIASLNEEERKRMNLTSGELNVKPNRMPENGQKEKRVHI